MKKQEKTKEQQEDSIFELFSNWKSSTSPAETKKYYDQLCASIYNWYKKYYHKNNMDEEIIIVINKLTNKNKKLNIPKNKDEFFKYLYKSLKYENINSYRKFNDKKSVDIPKNEMAKLKKLNKIIAYKENKLRRKLTEEEKIQCATTETKLFKKQVYINCLNLEKIGGIHLFKNKSKIDLHGDYLTKNNIAELKGTVKYVLDKKQKRARDCCKALFTLYCVKNDLKELYPILDQKILDSFHKNRKKPKQYEIYLKYHPKVTKKSAEAQASTNLHIFLNDIRTCLKERKMK
ncbi:hypothetical protein R84B8_00815 [Treponema sp. R8-4-B8]